MKSFPTPRAPRAVAAGFATACAFLWIAACSVTPRELPLPYRQAEDAFRLGDYERAVRAYRVFLDSDQRDDLVPRAYFKMAAAQFRRERYAEALAILDEFRERYPREKYPQMYALRGDVEEVRGNLVAAITQWEQAYELAEDEERDKVFRRIDNALAAMNSSSLAAVAGVVTNSDIRDLVELRRKGGAPPRSAAVRRESGKGSGESGGAPVASSRIACMLPLSGPYADYGLRSLNGLKLGLGERAAELIVRDTRGAPQTAREVLEGLIKDQDVIAVIGPLRSEVAESVASAAEVAGLPMLLLSQRDAKPGRFVFQIALTPTIQAAALSRFAVKELELSRFGILHPGDVYGSVLAEAFKREVARNNARVVGMQSYPAGAREFAVERLSVKQWHEKDGLEAVFLPDSAETAGLLGGELRRATPQLALLGGSAWNDRKALSDVSLGLEGGIFVDGFFEASNRPATRTFVEAFENAYGSTPGILEAQAYDAGRIARRVLSLGGRNRNDFATHLATLGDYDGASGHMRFTSGGVTRQVFVLQLTRGVIREIGASEATTGMVPPPPAEVSVGADN